MCASVSSLFDTWWHTRSLRHLFGWGARTRCPRGGNLRALWAFFYEKSPLSSVSLFEEGGAAVCFPRCKTHCCRGTEENELVGLAGGSDWWVREGGFPSRTRRPRTKVSCWMMMMRSLWHHLIQRLVLCWVMPRKSRRCLRAKKLRLSPLNPSALRMTSCWGLWNAPRRGLTCHLPWKRAKMVAPRGRLDERYISGHSPPAWVSLPFLPDLHAEVEREWKKPFSSHIHRFQHTSYANIEGMRENGYEGMPPVEETLASYLSVGETSSLKAPSLLSKPLQETSCLNGRAYAAAGQAVASLHTMAVLQAYQADLLKDLDKGQGLSPDEVAELRHTTDLALRATKQATTAMGRSMATMVVTERHLWVNLADIGKKEKGFLLDAPVSPSELFGTSVETVKKFREAKACSAAFKTFIPRRSRSEPEQRTGPGPSPSGDQKWAQKASVMARAPPPPAGRARGRCGSKRGRQDLREVIQMRRS